MAPATKTTATPAGTLAPLPPVSQAAADKSYLDTLVKLAGGLEKVFDSYATAADPHRKQVHALWAETIREGLGRREAADGDRVTAPDRRP